MISFDQYYQRAEGFFVPSSVATGKVNTKVTEGCGDDYHDLPLQILLKHIYSYLILQHYCAEDCIIIVLYTLKY